MRFVKIFRNATLLTLILAAMSCNVHEWPNASDKVQLTLELNFATDFTERDYTYTDRSIVATGDVSTEPGALTHGAMHCTVRAYPTINGVQQGSWEEFSFTRDLSAGYDCAVPLTLTPGQYTLLVWAELTESEGADRLYNSDEFSEIRLRGGEHAANTDYRDAFSGTADIDLAPETVGTRNRANCSVAMTRPLAKYQFVTTDVQAFLQLMTAGNGSSSEATRASLTDYEILFRYVGYMPNAYSLFTDKPSDSAMGVQFRSELSRLNNSEASLGFDYVFVKDAESTVSVQIEVYRKTDGQLVSRTMSIRVPLNRDEHTVIRGAFISDTSLADSSGGVGIDPGYEGDIDIPVKND